MQGLADLSSDLICIPDGCGINYSMLHSIIHIVESETVKSVNWTQLVLYEMKTLIALEFKPQA